MRQQWERPARPFATACLLERGSGWKAGRGHVGGGGCLGGYYDGAHRLAAISARYDTYWDTAVFVVLVPPRRLTVRSLGAIRTARGGTSWNVDRRRRAD